VENSLTYEIKRKLSLASKILSKKILKTVSIFEETFGVPQWRRKDPLDELMLTILSQNTNDRNRDNAYHKLRAQFPTWEKVMQADVELIEGAIRSAGLSKQKSKNMKNALLWINDYFGDLSLDKIRSLSDDEAIELLTSQKGVGIKTAAVMLAFSLDRDLCPVDTHVHRIALRLGWVREKTNAVNTFKLLRVAMPRGKAATFHLNLLRFGREICNARSPKCGGCPLFEVCKWKGRHDFK